MRRGRPLRFGRCHFGIEDDEALGIAHDLGQRGFGFERAEFLFGRDDARFDRVEIPLVLEAQLLFAGAAFGASRRDAGARRLRGAVCASCHASHCSSPTSLVTRPSSPGRV